MIKDYIYYNVICKIKYFLQTFEFIIWNYLVWLSVIKNKIESKVLFDILNDWNINK